LRFGSNGFAEEVRLHIQEQETHHRTVLYIPPRNEFIEFINEAFSAGCGPLFGNGGAGRFPGAAGNKNKPKNRKTKMKTGTSNKPTALSVDEIKATTAKVAALLEQMTFVVPLSASERQAHRSVRMGPRMLRVLGNRLAAAQEHRDLLPPAFAMKKFERDAALTSALGDCLAVINRMRDGVNDTLLTVGKRAILASTAAYGYIKVSSVATERLKKTVETLAVRTSRQADSSAAPVGPAPPEPSPARSAAVPEAPVKTDPGAAPTNKAA
jgi:hypothetical protein